MTRPDVERRVLRAAMERLSAAHELMSSDYGALLTDDNRVAIADAVAAALSDTADDFITVERVCERVGEGADLDHEIGKITSRSAVEEREFRADMRMLNQVAWCRKASLAVSDYHRAIINGGTAPDELHTLYEQVANQAPPTGVGPLDPARLSALALRHQPPRRRAVSIRSGFRVIDQHTAYRWKGQRKLGGFFSGQLVLIAAPTGVGKTSFIGETMLRGMKDYHERFGTWRPVIAYVAEMDPHEILKSWGLRGKTSRWTQALGDEGSHKVIVAEAHDAGIHHSGDVVDSFRSTVYSIVERCRQEGMSDPLAVAEHLPLTVAIDYSKWFISDDAADTGRTVVALDALGKILRTQLGMAKAFDLDAYPELVGYAPLVFLANQLKPKVSSLDAYERYVPVQGDLAWCKSLADHSNVVLLLHRPGYPDPDDHRAMVVISKYRERPTSGPLYLHWDRGIFTDKGEGRAGHANVDVLAPWPGYSPEDGR